MTSLIPYRKFALWNTSIPVVGPDTQLSALTVNEQPDAVVVSASVSGVGAEGIQVSMTRDVLTIAAETRDQREAKRGGWYARSARYGRVARSIRVPADVDVDRAEAALNGGVLTVRLPRLSAGGRRNIAINPGAIRRPLRALVDRARRLLRRPR